MIAAEAVRDALRNSLGSALTADPGFAEGIIRVFCSYAPHRDTFASLSRRMEDHLFNALYERLGPGMTVRLDNGSFRRILMSDLPSVTDEAMYPFFASLKPYSVHYEQLHAWWMETGSFSAMRTLYQNFQDYLPEQEQLLIERIVHENIPAHLQEAWLKRKDVLNP